MKKWIITAVAAVVVAGAIIIFLPKRGKVMDVPPPLVEATRVSKHTVSRSIDLIGYVTPMKQTAAIARSYGKVTSINVNQGNHVYKDQVLLTLQPDEVGLEFKPQPVKAPISGVVAEVLVKEGEPVAPNAPVVTIIDPSEVEIEVAVAGEYYKDVKVSDRALLISNPDTIPAKVKSKSPTVDPRTRTFNITLSPERASADLIAGLSLSVRLILEERKDVIAVPNSALQDSKLLVVSSDTVEQRNVKLGLRGIDFTQVSSGLDEGEKIITFGGQNLQTGQKVRTVLK